jgi:hypothetical protein
MHPRPIRVRFVACGLSIPTSSPGVTGKGYDQHQGEAAMSKGFPNPIVIASVVFAVAVPIAAQTTQTNPETSQQRPTELVPVCAPATVATPETMTPVATLTAYNPVAASTPPLTFYNPSAFARPPLTFYTPLGQIDPPIRVPTLSSPPAQTMPSALLTPSQAPMPATQTIPSPGPCPAGSQVERVAR